MSSITFRGQCDSEFVPVLNTPTIPHSMGIQVGRHPKKMYLHPNHTSVNVQHQIFKSPCVILDYLKDVAGYEYEEIGKGQTRGKHILTLKLFSFWSFKDLEHLFSERSFYSEFVLPKLERTRRISGQIPLPYRVQVGKKWYSLNLKIMDISAMQGAAGLKTYGRNVGFKMESKSIYSMADKKAMDKAYDKNPQLFEEYNFGDLNLDKVHDSTVGYYNKLASLWGIEPRESWGMSTGKICASIMNAWLQKVTGLSEIDLENVGQFSNAHNLSKLSELRKEKDNVYLPMVDGGRAVREVYTTAVVRCLLNDIDIKGAYGNGLMAQDFALGNPTLIPHPMTLREALKRYGKYLVAGLWIWRVSTLKPLPFRQDVLISKLEEAFTQWENGLGITDDRDGEEKIYDASMVLLRTEIRHATLNHDLFQILKVLSSKSEYSYLLDNLYVESGLMYLSCDEVKDVKDLDVKGIKLVGQKGIQGINWSTKWLRIPLSGFVGDLLSERAKAQKEDGKGSPRDTFSKLCTNTIYGCQASEHFWKEAVSNVVVAGNITGRVRALGYLMAKGFGSYITVTDGGFFDPNRVIFYSSLSLAKLEKISSGSKTTVERGEIRKFAVEGGLGGYDWSEEAGSFYINDGQKNRKYAEEGGLGGRKWKINDPEAPNIDVLAWEHLKKQFQGIDLLDKDQFSFESKQMYLGADLKNKIDYRFHMADGSTKVAGRGVDKIPELDSDGNEVLDASGDPVKVVDPNIHKLFDAVVEDEPAIYTKSCEVMLSLGDYRKSGKSERFKDLLPHDTYSKTKNYFSHTPLSVPFDTMEDYNKVRQAYEKAKETLNPNEVAKIAEDYMNEYLLR